MDRLQRSYNAVSQGFIQLSDAAKHTVLNLKDLNPHLSGVKKWVAVAVIILSLAAIIIKGITLFSTPKSDSLLENYDKNLKEAQSDLKEMRETFEKFKQENNFSVKFELMEQFKIKKEFFRQHHEKCRENIIAMVKSNHIEIDRIKLTGENIDIYKNLMHEVITTGIFADPAFKKLANIMQEMKNILDPMTPDSNKEEGKLLTGEKRKQLIDEFSKKQEDYEKYRSAYVEKKRGFEKSQPDAPITQEYKDFYELVKKRYSEMKIIKSNIEHDLKVNY